MDTAYKENFKRIDWSGHEYRPKRPIRFDNARSDFPTPMIAGDYKPYECPITGRLIDGRREHRENLKQHGCRILEKGEFEDVKKNGNKRRQEEIDRAIDKAVENAAAEI